jgi:hypothetical protein
MHPGNRIFILYPFKRLAVTPWRANRLITPAQAVFVANSVCAIDPKVGAGLSDTSPFTGNDVFAQFGFSEDNAADGFSIRARRSRSWRAFILHCDPKIKI